MFSLGLCLNLYANIIRQKSICWKVGLIYKQTHINNIRKKNQEESKCTDDILLATAKLTSFSVMPLNENETFHARKTIILKTKAQIRKFITANEKLKARKRKFAKETLGERKQKHANETPKAHTY